MQRALDAVAAAHKAITGADKAQEHKRAKAPLNAQDRNRTTTRILEAVARIAGAGGLELADDPKVLADLTALKPPSRKKGASKIAPTSVPVTPAEPLKKTG